MGAHGVRRGSGIPGNRINTVGFIHLESGREILWGESQTVVAVQAMGEGGHQRVQGDHREKGPRSHPSRLKTETRRKSERALKSKNTSLQRASMWDLLVTPICLEIEVTNMRAGDLGSGTHKDCEMRQGVLPSASSYNQEVTQELILRSLYPVHAGVLPKYRTILYANNNF